MTQDEIIEMARQSGAIFDHMTWVERDLLPVFERFAKLVAAKEREALRERFQIVTAAETRAAILNEREACANLCVDMVLYTGVDCADAIRARGEA